MARMVRRIAPYLLFLAVFLWGWRVWDAAHALPAYDDVLEVTWALRWYDGALRGLHSFSVYPLAFYPTGWHVATFGEGPAMFLPMLPVYWLGGAALAYNVTAALGLLLAFAGMLQLSRRFVDTLPATIAAMLFTFWGFNWFRIAGHLNILLATALLPWMAWAIEGWLGASQPRYRWLILAGLLWAFTVLCSWYFIWIGGLLLILWLVGRLIARQTGPRQVLIGAAIPAAVALVLSAPWMVWFVRESAAAGSSFFDISDLNRWEASLNSLPVPSINHPYLSGLARWIYRGPVNEAGQANLGLLACLLAVIGLIPAMKDRRWWPVIMLSGVSLLLALGLTLQWNGYVLQWPVLKPLDTLIWRAGHALKPSLFVSGEPSPPFDLAVPMPGLLFSALVPFWEGARVSARFALLGSLGVFLLAALGLGRLRKRWMQIALAGLLLFELLPRASGRVPFPPPSHPAFDWLREQASLQGGIIDLSSWQPELLFMPIGGATLWATEYHRLPTVAGASSVWPAHVLFLDRWLQSHPHAFLSPELVPILRYYGVRLVVYHVWGGYAAELLADAKQNPELQNLRCFEPLSTTGPWAYPICTMEIRPSDPAFNVLFREGWSGAEQWGRWAEGTEARAEWVATTQAPHTLVLNAFPFCVPNKQQQVRVAINGVELASHEWQKCEEWTAEVKIPGSSVQVGWNTVVLHSDYALRPADVTGNENSDPRPLAIGVRKLLVAPDVRNPKEAPQDASAPGE